MTGRAQPWGTGSSDVGTGGLHPCPAITGTQICTAPLPEQGGHSSFRAPPQLCPHTSTEPPCPSGSPAHTNYPPLPGPLPYWGTQHHAEPRGTTQCLHSAPGTHPLCSQQSPEPHRGPQGRLLCSPCSPPAVLHRPAWFSLQQSSCLSTVGPESPCAGHELMVPASTPVLGPSRSSVSTQLCQSSAGATRCTSPHPSLLPLAQCCQDAAPCTAVSQLCQHRRCL